MDNDEEQFIFVKRDVTCHTDGCFNAEIKISVIGVENSVVICGVCAKEITDIIEMGQYNE